jgi:type IV secretory pathway VirB10-like protein
MDHHFDEDDTETELTAEPEGAAAQKADGWRDDKWDDPKLTSVPDVDDGVERIRRRYVVAGLVVAAVLLCGGGLVFAARSKSSGQVEREVRIDRGKTAAVSDAIAKLPAYAAKEEAREARQRHPDALGLSASAYGATADDSVDPGSSLTDEAAANSDDDDRIGQADDAAYSGARAQVSSTAAEPSEDDDDELPPAPPLGMWRREASTGARMGAAPNGPMPQPRPVLGAADAPANTAQGLAQRAFEASTSPAQNDTEADPDGIKEAFAARQNTLDATAVARDLAECEVIAGQPISSSNLTALNTDVPARSSIQVMITQPLYCGADRQYVAAPAGSTFTASANARVSYGDGRIQVCMDQLHRTPSKEHPRGDVLPVACWAAAEIDGTPGWAAEVDNHWPQLIAGVALSTILSLGTTATAGSQQGFAPTLAQGAARQAGTQLNMAGTRIVQRDLARKPTLTREMLRAAKVIVTQNQAMEPWHPRRGRNASRLKAMLK